MTSTSVTKVGGVLVVTQVIPQDEGSIPLQTAAPPTQPPAPVTQAPPPASAKMDDMTASFLRGQPQGLGVVQIFIGGLCVLFSLSAVYSDFLILHAPFCLAVCFVVSGSVVLAALRRTSFTLVCAALVWNLMSAVVGLGGVAYLCWLLTDRPPRERFCFTDTWGEAVPTEEDKIKCRDQMWLLNATLYGSLGLLLVLLVLEVCVAVTVSVFSGKAIQRRGRHALVTVVVDDGRPLMSAHDSDVALLDSESDETNGSPPNSP